VIYVCSDDVCTNSVRSTTTLQQFTEVGIPLTPQHVSSDTCHNHQCALIGNKTCEQHLEGIEGSVRQRLLHSLKRKTLQEDFLVLLIPCYTVIPEHCTIIPLYRHKSSDYTVLESLKCNSINKAGLYRYKE
jgi:hypothetical protein